MYFACCCFCTAANPVRKRVFSGSGGLFCHSRRWEGRVGVLEM